ncbi:MAG: replicative DNA helicase [Clostridiales bacterium]|nr:replicative DNA helicase [Clostridiales bacterium]
MDDNAILAEQSFCGSILLDKNTAFWPDCRGFLLPEDFLSRECEGVYRAACALLDEGATVDPVTVREKTGCDSGFLLQLMDVCAMAVNARAYAETVHRQALSRRAAALCADLGDRLHSGGVDPSAAILETSGALEGLLTAESDASTVSAAESFQELWTWLSSDETGLLTLPTLDRLTGGFQPGKLYVIAGRPGCGKSALGVTLASVMAQTRRVTYCTLEMEARQVTERILSSYSGVSFAKIEHKADLSDQDARRLWQARERYRSLRLTINRRPEATAEQIEVMARQSHAEALIVDHLGLVSGRERETEYQQVTRNSRQMKLLARRLGIPVILQVQLSREAEREEQPRLWNLRSSGAIEQDADVVLLLHSRVQSEDGWQAQEVLVNVAKNRSGPTKTFPLQWYKATNRFVDEGRLFPEGQARS